MTGHAPCWPLFAGFSLSFSCSGSNWVVPGAEFSGIPTKTLSKVKHIARPACGQALKSTASQGVISRPTRRVERQQANGASKRYPVEK